MLFFIICILLRAIAVSITSYGWYSDKGKEGNPIMNYLFNKIGFIKGMIIINITTLISLIYISFFSTNILVKCIVLGILVFDAVFDIITFIRIKLFSKQNF